ncbi:MAG: HEPN domain-containing protein [Pseudomonadota bacterium]
MKTTWGPDEIINRFKGFLLASEVGARIAKVFLFGSHAKKTATADSDIDVLVFTSDGRDVEDALMDHVYDFMVENDAPLEVMTRPVDDLFNMQDYFIYNVVRYGIEVYSMDEKQIKKAAVDSFLGLCEEYLESAREVLDSNRIRLAIDAGYNAAELAGKALILLKQDDLPGSHGGVVSLLGQLYVKTELTDKTVGRNLNRSLKLRNEARYRPDAVFSEKDARFVLDVAEKLLDLARNRWKELM